MWVEIVWFMFNFDNNGGCIFEEIVYYFIEYELVFWAWELGVDVNGIFCEKLLVFKVEYIKVVKVWVVGGVLIFEE